MSEHYFEIEGEKYFVEETNSTSYVNNHEVRWIDVAKLVETEGFPDAYESYGEKYVFESDIEEHGLERAIYNKLGYLYHDREYDGGYSPKFG